MNKIEVEELLKVLETIRAEKHPEIPPRLINDIVQAQFESQDDRAEGSRKTKKLIDDFLKEVVKEN